MDKRAMDETACDEIEAFEDEDDPSLDPCDGCGNQGSTAMFGHLPPGDGLNLCRDACDVGRKRKGE